MTKNKLIGIAVLFLLIVASLSYLVFGPGLKSKPVVASVATVNGVVIPKSTFDTQLAQAITASKAQGADPTNADTLAKIKTQVLNDMITNELVMQGVATLGLKATPEQIQAQYDAIISQLGGQDKLDAQLKTSAITDAQLRDNIAKQIVVEAYLLQNIATSSITVSDAEIADFYANYSKGQTNVPPLKDLSAQIKQQITLNKQQDLVNQFIETLRAKAKIETAATI